MNRYLLPLLFAVCLVLTGTAHGAGGFDSVQLEYQRAYTGPLRWDDLFATDQWLGGENPSAAREDTGMSTVELAPGEEVRLLLPASAVLRIHAPGGAIVPADIELFHASGSPLFVQGETAASDDTHSLLFTPDATRPLVCLVRRPLTAANALRVAIFISRQTPVPEIAPYRQRLEITGNQTLHFPLDAPVDRRLNLLRQGEATEREITGPLRLALVNRLLYRAGDPARRQNYRLSASLDDHPAKIMEFASSPEEHLLFCPDADCLVPGREERDFLEIPDGHHRLRLTADRDLLLSLLTREDPDYLFPALNAPESDPLDHGKRLAEDNRSRPLWAVSDQQALKTLTAPKPALPDLAQAARKLAQDNSRRPQGLLAAWLLRQRAMVRQDDPELRRLAEELYGNHSFFRDLFPYASDRPLDQRYLLYHDRRLARPDDTDLVLAQQHRDDLLDQIGHGYFTTATEPSAPATWSVLRYRLPPQDSPGILRVLATPVTRPHAMRITIDGVVRTLRLEPELAQPTGSFTLATSEAALEMLRQSYPSESGSTLDGPYATRRPPAPLADVANVDLPLPAAAREITIATRNETQAEPLFLALQYRAGKPVFFNDREYQDALQLTAADPALREQLRAQLFADQPAPQDLPAGQADPQALYRRDIQNYAMAAARLLASHRATYRAPVFSRPTGLTRLDPAQAAANFQQAQQAASEGNWLGALEHASQAVLRAKGEAWLAARIAQVQALRQLGEDYLAEGMLRELLLYPPPEVGDQGAAAAFKELAAQYRRDREDASLLQLYAIRLTQVSSPALLREYLDLLVANGYFPEALVAALLLPEAERPLPLMARAARTQNWPGTVQALVAKLPGAGDQAYWTGLSLLDQGQYGPAQEELAKAGDQGRPLLTMLREGQAIRTGLMSGKPDKQRQAFQQWQAWQGSLPLPGSWQSAPWLVRDYAGSRTLYSTPLDLYGRAFLATEAKPLRLSLLGPTRLRISARPLHAAAATDPLDGWLELDDNGTRLFTDISGNLPAPGVRLAEDQEQVPGRMVVKEFSFGAGAHAVTVHANTIPVLLQVEAFQPDVAPPVLPRLTAETARRLLTPAGVPPPAKAHATDKNQADLGDMRLSILAAGERPKANTSDFADVWQRNREEELPPPGQDAASAGPLADLLTPPPPARDDQEAESRLTKTARQCTAASTEDPVGCMTALLRLAELSPPARAWAVAKGEELFARYPAVPALQPLYARLTAGNTWQPVSAVQSPAGVRFVPIQGWQPESPLLKIRKALLGLGQDNERVLYGQDRLLLSYKNLAPVHLRLDFLLAEPAFLKPEELALAYQLDAGPEQPLTLSPDDPSRKVELEIPAGQHAVAVWISKRYANQFLRVRFTEPEPGETAGLTATTVRLEDQEERPYALATPKEPVTVSAKGPGWLRIDELRGTEVLATYRLLADGWQKIPLKPAPGQPQALFRVHEKIAGAKEVEPPLPRPALPVFTPVPPPLAAVTQPRQLPGIEIRDALPLGDQQDATWEARAALVSRMGNEEDRQAGINDDYLELALLRRHADLPGPEYLKVTGLARLRENDAHTLGLLADYAITPRSLPATFLLEGDVYVQDLQPVGADGRSLDDAAGSVRVQAGISRRFDLGLKTYHLPSAGLFARWLSMDSSAGFPAGSIDYDVFTPYKAEHRHGLTAGDTLYHRPWLDTYWFAGVRAVSNEDLNLTKPDHLQANFGWRQLLGPFTAELALQLTSYLDDNDRDHEVDTRMLKFELAWNHWFADRNQLQASLNIRNDLEGNSGGFFAISWLFSPRRELRDIRQSEAPFKDLQGRELMRDHNNTMPPAAPGYTLQARP